MKYINKLMVRVRESKKGQTMTEYVLIIAAIAVAGYIAYQGLEGGINTIISNVTTTLKGAQTARSSQTSRECAQRMTSTMKCITKLVIRLRETQKGQTMTEYVLIIAAIAVAGY